MRYEFAGWYYLGKEWDFDNGIVNYDIKLQSQWREIAIEGVTPDEPTTDNGSDMVESNADSSLAGCSGVIGGVASGLTVLGVAAYVLLKKKEN